MSTISSFFLNVVTFSRKSAPIQGSLFRPGTPLCSSVSSSSISPAMTIVVPSRTITLVVTSRVVSLGSRVIASICPELRSGCISMRIMPSVAMNGRMRSWVPSSKNSILSMAATSVAVMVR